MRNTNRRGQNRSSNQSWSQPWANRNRESQQQRFMNEGNEGRGYSSGYDESDDEFDREGQNRWPEHRAGNRGYSSNEFSGQNSGRQLGRDFGREQRGQQSREEYRGQQGGEFGLNQRGGFGRGYGNDPESFARSQERSNFGNTGREYYGDSFDTTSFGGAGRGNYGTGEGYGGNRGQGQGSNWAFGRSWNRDEDEYGTMGNRGQQQQFGQSTWHDTQESHRGKGPKGYQRSDERIREDINEQLSDDHQIDASEIEVKVEKGEVTLTGSVNERITKHLVEEIVESVSGVKNVENRIRVTTGTEEKASQQQPQQQGQGPTTKSNDRSKMRESVA